MGKGSNTTYQASAPNPVAMSAYQDVISRSQAAANTPYQAYTGQEIAPVNAQQTAGIGGINTYANSAQPLIAQGANQMASSSSPLTAGQIQQYISPYTQDVVNATEAQFNLQNAQQQSQITGNAASQGALGGDRSAVAAALGAQQQNITQAPVIAGLYNTGYNNAVNTAEQQQQIGLQGGAGLVNAGVQGQQAGLQGAEAQVGAGTLQQQTQQAQDTQARSDYFQQQGYDFQTAQWLANQVASAGSLMGGTSSTQGPTPNPWAQVAGVGLAAASLSDERVKENIQKVGELNDGQPIYRFNYKGDQRTQIGLISQKVEKDHPDAVHHVGGVGMVDYRKATEDAVERMFGGRTNRASGGYSGPWAGADSWIPSNAGLPHGSGPPKPPAAPSQQGLNATQLKGMGKGLANIGSKASSAWNSYDPNAGAVYTPPEGMTAGVGYGENYGPSLMPDASISGFGPMMESNGGGVRGYATRGAVDDDWDPYGEHVVAGFGTGTIMPHDDWRESRADPALTNSPAYYGIRPESPKAGFGERFDEEQDALRPYEAKTLEDQERYRNAQLLGSTRYDYTNDNPGVGRIGAGPIRDMPPAPDILTNEPMPRPRPPSAPSREEEGPVMVAGLDRPRAVKTTRMTADDVLPKPGIGTRPIAYAPEETEGRRGLTGLLNMSPEARQGLLMAGLGMMATRRGGPGSFLGAMGEGGIQGVAGYQGAEALKQERQEKSTEETNKDRQLSIQEAHYNALAKQSQAQLAATTAYHASQLEEQRKQHNLALRTPFKYMDKTGQERLLIPKASPTGEIEFWPYDPETGRLASSPLGGSLAEGVQRNQQRDQEFRSRSGIQNVAMTDGIIPANNRLVSSGPYDYTENGPVIEKGMEVPEPRETAGRSSQAVRIDAENYLQTGKLPPVRSGRSPVAIQQNNYRNAVQNYGSALAQSRDLTPAQTAEMWRTAPGMLRFILGADGRSTVSLGTAVRHLDSLRELAKAWDAGDVQALNKVRASISRQFGADAATNLEVAGKIIGPEIIKAIGVAGAGTAEERIAAQQAFSAASSPRQMIGAIVTVQKLLGGQLEGRERQAMNAGVSHERFKSLIGDRPYEILSEIEKGGAGAGAGAQGATVPVGSVPMKKRDGTKFWKLPDGTVIPRNE